MEKRNDKKGELQMMEAKTELMTAAEVAGLLGTTPLKVTKAIHEGNLPIGFVIEAEPGKKEKNRTIIVRKRFERWMNGDDLRLVAGET